MSLINSKSCLLTIVLFIIIFFFSFNINYLNDYSWKATTSKNSVKSRNNKYLVVIGSSVDYGSRRELIRSSYFGIEDNLVPIVPSQSIQYAFCIYGDLPKSNTPEKRAFETEKMEYNDVYTMTEEFNRDNVIDWVRNRLMERKGVEFDYLIVQDINSFIRLDRLVDSIEESNDTDIVWGTDEKGFVIGSSVFNNKYKVKESRGQALSSQVWQNSIESVKEDSLLVTDIYGDKDYYSLCGFYPQGMIQLKRTRSNRVVVTSSYIYDRCMEPSGTKASLNKRDYADKHNYAFIARSNEFAQQALRPDKRRTVWGKIDVIQKVLPKYEWLFWLDMDAVVMNDDISLDNLMKDLIETHKPKEDVHFIIVRPGTDKMINAGVFLIKNTPWSFQFLQAIQQRQEWYRQGPSYEQGAMWDVMRKEEYLKHTLYLDRENHVFNTFPKFYENDDFIVHFAPDKCPNAATLKGLAAAEKIKLGQRVTANDLL